MDELTATAELNQENARLRNQVAEYARELTAQWRENIQLDTRIVGLEDELTLSRRQADEYAREADALRADVARLTARVLELEGQERTPAEQLLAALNVDTERIRVENEQLRAENELLRAANALSAMHVRPDVAP